MLHKVCRSGDLNLILEDLLKHKSQINEKDEGLGWTALYRAVICDQYEVCETLLLNGADPNIPNNLGQIPLHSACESGNSTMVDLLISFNSDCNFQSCTGDSPLHHAASRGDFTILKTLLEHGAIPNLQNKVLPIQLGQTPYYLASESRSTECLQLLQDYGSSEPSEKDYKKSSDANSEYQVSEDAEMKAVYLTSKSEDISEIESSPHIYELFNTFGGLSSVLKESKKVEKILLLEWLNDNNLTELYDVLLDSGYDDHIVMSRQMLSAMPIKRKNLGEIGIFKPGYQRRLLFCLEEEGRKRTSAKRESLAPWVTTELLTVLSDLRMDHYIKNFIDAGYDDYGVIVKMHGTKWGINERVVKNELKIFDMHEIQRLLARIQKDSAQSKADNSVLFEEPKNIACSRCAVI